MFFSMRFLIIGICMMVSTAGCSSSSSDTPEQQPEFIPGTPLGEEEKQAMQACVGERCMPELSACIGDEDCNGWLACSDECGQYNMGCETFCGFYYQSTIIDNFVECVTGSDCFTINYSYIPHCEKPTGDYLDLSGISGEWWLSYANAGAHVFDEDCQKFYFRENSASSLSVTVTVPLKINDVERIAVIEGSWTRQAEGHSLVEYGAFANFTERWYILHKSENVIVAHLCFVSYGNPRNYGKLVLTRLPYSELSNQERSAAEKALAAHGVSLSDLTKVRTTSCSNE